MTSPVGPPPPPPSNEEEKARNLAREFMKGWGAALNEITEDAIYSWFRAAQQTAKEPAS